MTTVSVTEMIFSFTEKLASLTGMIASAMKSIFNVTKITAFTTETIDSLAELIA